jgi:hypothetical protein
VADGYKGRGGGGGRWRDEATGVPPQPWVARRVGPDGAACWEVEVVAGSQQ